MQAFQWDKHFETGILEVDEQHHRLVDIINQFGDHLAKNELVSEDINLIIKELSDYTTYHFDEEETMMVQVGIDQRHLDQQLEAHRYFLDEINTLHAGVSIDDPASAQHLLDFLSHWLAFHILGSDQNMARQVKLIKNGFSPAEAYDKEEKESDSATEPLLVALNGLFRQVSSRNKELVKLNQSLEDKVAVRTKALSEANSHLEILALTDVLTGLPNRRHAMQKLSDLWDESTESDNPLVCMMIDADHFKEVNDTYGHDAGDDVLRGLAKELQGSVRSDDIVCRLGGDEFLIICPNTGLKGGMTIAELTRKKVADLRIQTGDGNWHGSISVGVAVRLSTMNHHEELIKIADDGVYAAKRDGKNCVRTTS